MADMTSLLAGTRTFLRDFPKYFEVEQGPLNVLTIRLPHPYVSASALQVYVSTEDATQTPPVLTTELTEEWQLDDRNGLLKLTNDACLGKRILVAGYHYTWFSDADLQHHLRNMVYEHATARPSAWSITDISGAEIEVLEIGAVVHALWSLATELSLDIDVSTPEGMFIPAHQRYSQVLQMMQYWEGQYNTKAASLNVGLGAIEIFQVRRVAYMTGRYVPVYRAREFDNPLPPERLYPAIPEGGQSFPPGPDSPYTTVEQWTEGGTPVTATYTKTPYPEDVPRRSPEELMREGQDLGFGGWGSLGTQG